MDGRPPAQDRDQVIARLGVVEAPLAKPGETIVELFDRYEKETLRLANKKAATVATERKVIAHFAAFVGERRAVGDIREEDIREFKAALLAVPNRWTSHAGLKGASLKDAAHQWRARGGKGRSPTTIRRELSAVSTFFKWLKQNAFYSGRNPVADFFPAVDKKKNKYPPYTPEELETVFASPLFHRCRSGKLHKGGHDEVRDWRYWLPLCALFTGARAGEIAQLACGDVRQEEDVWIFDINDDPDTADEGPDKSVKTAASRRQVPVHPALLALGFVEHVAKVRAGGGKRIFPEIKPGPDGSWSYQPSKFWQRYLARLGVKRRGLGLHSFRHGFADECRRRSVPDEVIKGLMGHADGSQTAHYGTLRSGNLGQRREAINALSFFGLAAGLPPAAAG
jgi:integrase